MGMRFSPTSGFTAWVSVSVAIAALVGCAASGDAESETPTEDPSTEAKDDDSDSKKEETKAEQKTPAPTFDANFTPTTNDPTKEPSKDPAPPNADSCIDNGDPGGNESLATKLPDTDDCDNGMKTLTGTINGAVDVDYYKLSATDKGVSFSHPIGCSLDTDFQAETAGTELCVFMKCKNTTKDAVTGCEQGTQKTSDIGMKGCCAAAPGRAVPKWDCSGITDNDSADIFMRVRQINGDKCLPYKVSYRY
jgi:hypothetical protein